MARNHTEHRGRAIRALTDAVKGCSDRDARAGILDEICDACALPRFVERIGRNRERHTRGWLSEMALGLDTAYEF